MSKNDSNFTILFNTDLLEMSSKEAQVIAQQCNCTSKKSRGLAEDIIEKYPYADFYSKRKINSIPGTFRAKGPKENGRTVIAMFAQFNPGKVKKSGKDTAENREGWFKDCLTKIGKLKKLKSIAFPYRIGCGLAGGDWERYQSIIEDWAKTIPNKKVYIVCREDPPEEESDDDTEGEESDEDDSKDEKSDNPSFQGGENPKDEEESEESADEEESDDESKEEESDSLESGDESADKKAKEEDPDEDFENNPPPEFLRLVWNVIKGHPLINFNHLISLYKTCQGNYTSLITPTLTKKPTSELDAYLSDPKYRKLKPKKELNDILYSPFDPEIKDISKKEESSDDDDEEITYKNTTLVEFTKDFMPEEWKKFFKKQLKSGCIEDVSDFLKKEAKRFTIYPPLEEIYSAFDYCPLDDIKVVIIGQDPYYAPGAAMGLAFSHNPDRKKIQSSLLNIYKELKSDGFKPDSTSGDLVGWAQQGVFLINTALTVRQNVGNSHGKKDGPWSYFTEKLFKFLNEECDHLVIVMWGNEARKFAHLFDENKHEKIFGVHPSGLSANRGFFGKKYFSQINACLRKWKLDLIDWNDNVGNYDDEDED